jgi:hypothetical protein
MGACLKEKPLNRAALREEARKTRRQAALTVLRACEAAERAKWAIVRAEQHQRGVFRTRPVAKNKQDH